jgi:hypothetical protein
VEALQNNEISTGRGLNKKMNLRRLGDTLWISHYGEIINLILMFSSIIEAVEDIVENGLYSELRVEANILIQSLQTFEFTFNLHLMKSVLGITNELSQALQRKDQDILNAMKLVEVSKQHLQAMKEEGWNSLFEEVSVFYAKKKYCFPQYGRYVPTSITAQSSKHEKFASLSCGALLYCYRHVTDTFKILGLTWQYRIPKTVVNKEYNLHILFS